MMKDMTAGEPRKVLWYFSIPLLLSVAFQQLYSIVDSVIAGRFVGVDALAAVGASYPVTMIYIAVATGANIGGSVIISQYFGAKDYAHVKTAVYTALTGITDFFRKDAVADYPGGLSKYSAAKLYFHRKSVDSAAGERIWFRGDGSLFFCCKA